MPKKDSVFVVHGRNITARDEVVKFLQAVQLRVIEWEQAAQMTGLASPTTLDIVRAGIEEAQAVVVLLTGDDVARMHEVYGPEPVTLQPRPNVIFEAGWAFATAGKERTILVSFGPLRGFTDIDGINYLSISNDAAARKGLVTRLKTAGCTLDEQGSSYLSHETAGDFSKYIHPSSCSIIFPTNEDRGRFTEFIVDSTLSFTLSAIDFNRWLEADLFDAGTVEMKYHYIGPVCASYWLAQSADPGYGHSQLVKIISEHAVEMIDRLKEKSEAQNSAVDLVSLGPGDGQIDGILLWNLEKTTNVQYYYCIDISFDLLQKAVEQIARASWLNRKFRIKAIHGDFMELSRFAPVYNLDPSINLFVLTGYSLGNFNEANLLARIREGMRDVDFLFVDARLHDIKLSDWDGCSPLSASQKNVVSKNYRHERSYQFAFGPVEAVTKAKKDDVKFGVDVHLRNTVVPRSVKSVTYCFDLPGDLFSKRRVPHRDRVDLAVTTLYDLAELEKWFVLQGFEVVWSEADCGTGLFLLRRVG